MGFRTVVMLSNDQASTWENDPALGKKIASAMNYAHRDGDVHAEVGNYGRVVQCAHGDTQTLAVLDGYTFFQDLSNKSWVRDESQEEIAVKLLKEAAEKLGYRLSKIPARNKAAA